MDTHITHPKISVVLPVYNAEAYVDKAIESMLHQTYADFELIVINDGSTDRSLEIVRSYADPRIKVVSRENRGLVASLNEGIALAQGEYIARMDADDISLPQRFEKQVALLDAMPTVAVCGTWADVIDAQGAVKGDYTYPPINTKAIRAYVLRHNPFIHPTVMMRKNVFEKVGGYWKAFKHVEDYELWTRIVFAYDVANIPEKLLHYRVTDEGVTRENQTLMRFRGIRVRGLALMRLITGKKEE